MLRKLYPLLIGLALTDRLTELPGWGYGPMREEDLTFVREVIGA